VVADNVNGTFFGRFVEEGGGRVRVGSQVDGFVPNVTLSVSATAGTEAGATVITVTATATAAVTGDATVALAVAGAGITAGDFTLSSATITIPNGQKSGTVTFTVVNDTLVEGVETATLTISNPSANVALGATTAQNIAITSDDSAAVSISSVSQAEGNSGVTTFLFTVTLSNPSATEVKVNFTTADGTATTANADYTTNLGLVVFAPGETSQVIGVEVIGDTTAEADETFTVVLSNPVGAAIGTGTGTGTIVNDDASPPPPAAAQPALAGGLLNGSATPLAPSGGKYSAGSPLTFFAGQGVNVRTATADVNGDGTLDFIGGTGPGTAAQVVVLDGKTGATIASLAPFEASFVGGVFVTALDMDGDGKAEVVVSPDQGGGPIAAIYSGAKLTAGDGDAAQLLRYFAIDDPSFRGGARPTLGDINGDGKAELTVSAGFLGGPRITVWDGASVLAGAPRQLLNFFAFENTLRNGAFVSAGDVTGDGRADLIFGGGPGGAPRVRVFDGQALLGAGLFANLDDVGSAQRANFFAGDSALRGGVRLAMRDVDANGKADLVTGSGEGEASRVRVFLAGNLLANANPTADQELDPFGQTLANGVFVG
jgi:hypothetical protein